MIALLAFAILSSTRSQAGDLVNAQKVDSSPTWAFGGAVQNGRD